ILNKGRVLILEIIDRILLLLAGREQKELTDYLGLKSAAFSEWKSGKSKSYRKYLIEIAKFFNVSLDYLVYGKETASSNEIEFMNDNETTMMNLFRMLSEKEQDRIIGRLENMVEESHKFKNK
ncbi:MAG: helix-turn-helix domain-containing protein, partial [Ruminococcus sp.]|nr:helix-turn-helix domain-containing protein [Ruminococcus sp.]